MRNYGKTKTALIFFLRRKRAKPSSAFGRKKAGLAKLEHVWRSFLGGFSVKDLRTGRILMEARTS
jgi:hypothetical protein